MYKKIKDIGRIGKMKKKKYIMVVVDKHEGPLLFIFNGRFATNINEFNSSCVIDDESTLIDYFNTFSRTHGKTASYLIFEIVNAKRIMKKAKREVILKELEV